MFTVLTINFELKLELYYLLGAKFVIEFSIELNIQNLFISISNESLLFFFLLIIIAHFTVEISVYGRDIL